MNSYAAAAVLAGAAAIAFLGKDKAYAAIRTRRDSWTQYDSLFNLYAQRYSIDWKWLKAIALNESDLGEDPLVKNGEVSEDGKSWGLMQLRLSTARDFEPSVTINMLKDPEAAIRIAARFVSWLTQRFSPSEPRYREWVIKSYNQGVGNSRKERDGQIEGNADVEEYWERFQRNLKLVEEN